MLRFLGVRHLAVIDHLEVEFEPGLNVLTGETGAGKSILVEAIDLLVGGRASADLVRTGEDARDRSGRSSSVPDGREVIVRREVSAQGRSRAFIDDALATTAALRELGARARSICTDSTNIRRCSIRPSTSICSTRSPAHDALVADVGARASTSGAPRPPRSIARSSSEREKRARIEIASFQLQEIDKRRAASRRRRARSPPSASCSPTPTGSAGSRREAYAALYDGEAAALGVARRRLEARRRPRRARSRASRRTSSSATTIKSRLEDLAFFLRVVRARPRRVARAAAGRRRSARGARAPEEEDTARRSPTCSRGRRRSRDELAALDASDERAAALEPRASGRARASSCARAPAHRRRRARAAGRTARARRSKRALAELAMPKSPRRRPRRDRSSDAGSLDARAASTTSSSSCRRIRARSCGRSRASRRAASCRASCSRCARWPRATTPGRTLIFDEVDAGIGGAAADAVGARLQALGAALSGALHHAPAADRRARRRALPDREARARAAARRPRSRRLDDAGREAGDRAHDCRRRGLAAGAGVGARTAGRATAKAKQKRKAKAKVARRKRKGDAWRVSTSSRRSAVR